MDDLIEDPSPLIELLRTRLMKLASIPLICFILCLVFQEDDHHLPDSFADLSASSTRLILIRTIFQKVRLKLYKLFCYRVYYF